jgi:phospholipid/cholesterol/gamma-HCH transport system ATP-binding protein
MIEFEGVSKRFGEKVVLDGVSFSIAAGEVFFVIGTSGAGKSVLIKHLVGLLKADAGAIRFEGEDVTKLSEEELHRIRKRCAMVFQHATLFDSMTCAENVALPLRKHAGLSHRDALAEAKKRLEIVHMQDFADRRPAEIGDGLRKRVAIARALTLEPRAVLFDEPTTSLDPVSARRVDRLIRELADRLGVTCVVVSHDLESIFGIADRIAMLYRGRVQKLGTPAQFRSSDDAIVDQFVHGRALGPMEV